MLEMPEMLANGTTDEELLRVTLEYYCWWLNRWREEDVKRFGEQFPPYDVARFTIMDPDNHQWGSYTIITNVPMGGSAAFQRYLFAVNVYDGDDGGSTDLLTMFEASSFEDEPKQFRLIYLVQGFDTNLQTIYNLTTFNYSTKVGSPWKSLPVVEEA